MVFKRKPTFMKKLMCLHGEQLGKKTLYRHKALIV